jgi:DNA polymerase-3 subunit alpha
MVQTQSTLQQLQAAYTEGKAKDLFELQDTNLWMKSEDEMNAKWESDYQDVFDYELFKEAKRNTVRICQKAQGVELDRTIKLPKIDEENAKLREAVMHGFKDRGLPMTEEYLGRIKEELPLIFQKEFSSYFLIQKMMTDEARRWAAEQYGTDGTEAVGPGRGSGVGALTNFCLGVTDVDPLLHDLLFSRFMSPARGGKSIKVRFKGNYDPPEPEPEPEPVAVADDVPPWEEDGEKAPWEE